MNSDKIQFQFFSLIFLLFSFLFSLQADTLTPGKLITVTCKKDETQKYSCYLPKKYQPEKQYPIIYCFAPNAKGDYFVSMVMDVCEKFDWIAVGSLNSKNGPFEPIKKATAALWKDCNQRFNLSKTQQYACGFSGGARVSFYFAEIHSEIDGVFAIGAGLANKSKLPRKNLKVFWSCGTKDFNHKELLELAPRLKENGNPVKSEVFDGEHSPSPKKIWNNAFKWMNELYLKEAEEKLKQAMEEAKKLLDEDKVEEAYEKLKTPLDLYERSKNFKKAKSLISKILKKPALKEINEKAELLFNETLKWQKANKKLIKTDNETKEEAISRFLEIIKRYPYTKSAKQAEKKLKKLRA